MLSTSQSFVVGATVGGLHVGDIVVTIIGFSLLLFLLKIFAWGPLIKVMEEREEFVATELETAQEKSIQANRAIEEADEKLASARHEAKKIVVEARRSATTLEENIVNEARAVAKKMRQDAEEEIIIERQEAVQDMQEQVAEIAFQIAMDIIKKEMSPEDQKRLIQERLDRLGDELT
ncbi:F-type H+-transporting ATPase subunit b [Amphibacillus marinus]|uniref:ATP synthase subunit b n=1 Tax=Amphibacillus marinus TaxID=872970 RepID=A0A1H8N1S1_9BACI|nr:F0F1 ATP synthase subunit B [Amphibacillus marinus]SEO23557.1 F-type H+-transporting ATPase subunit b [Amphibacillus marinus]